MFFFIRLLKMQESGIMKRCLNMVFMEDAEYTDDIWEPVQLESALPILLICIIGIIFSMIILILENLLGKILNKKRKKRKFETFSR